MSDTNDMRLDFETWWEENMNTEEMDLHRHIYPGGTDAWSYACHETHRSWMTWQAATERATAIERERCAMLTYQAGMDGLAHAIRQGSDT